MAREGGSPLGALWDAVMAYLLVLAGAAMALAVGYVAYGIFFASDSLFAPARGTPGAANFPQVYHNLQLACTVATIAGALVIAAALGRYWMFLETGVSLLLLGAAFAFGVPFLVHNSAGTYPPALRQQSENLLVNQFTLIGIVFGAVGAVQLLIQGVIAFISRAQRRPSIATDISQGAFTGKKLEKQDKFLGPCWTLPFCRDSAKRVCPVLNRNRACWRDGRGCYCDQNIVLMLSGDRGRTATRSAQGFVSMQSLTQTRPKTGAEKRAQCLGCPIYLHRQHQKYRVFAPTSIVVVLGLILLNKVWLDETYPNAVLGAGRALRGFSFSGGNQAAGVPEWAQNLAQMQSVEWILLFVIGLLVVSYMIHILEWALYKMGI
jgi:hypothetical protein